MKRKRAVLVVFLVLAIVLVVYGNDVWQKEVSRRATENAPYNLAYESFTANVTTEAAALIKNKSGSFPSGNKTFSGDYIILIKDGTTEGRTIGRQTSLQFKQQKISDYSHLNITIVYMIYTKGRLAGSYSDGSRGYYADYDFYLIKYPEKAPMFKQSRSYSPPEYLAGKEGEKAGDQIGTAYDIDNWINANHK